MITRQRTHDITGEVLPPDDSLALAPLAQPTIRIHLPQARGDDAGLLEHEVRRPARAPSLEADVIVPGVQAAFTAIAAAICAGLLAWAFGWSWRVVAVMFGATLAVSWLARMRVADSLLWEVERLTGRDVNHDGEIGQPHGAVLVNAWEARQEAALVRADDDAQSERQELTAFLHRCFVAGCSERAHGVKAGSGATRDAYCEHRDVLLSLGIAAWRNPAKPNAGWRLVVSHQRAVDLLAKHTL